MSTSERENERFSRIFAECRKYHRNAQDFYAARYPNRQQKSHKAFKRLADRFWLFGTLKQTRVKRGPIGNENNAAATLAFAALNPYASSRQIEKKSGISQRFVSRILHQHKFNPYRMCFFLMKLTSQIREM